MLSPEEKKLIINLFREDLHFTEEQIRCLSPLLRADIEYKELVTHILHATAFNKYVNKEDMPDFIVKTLSQYYGFQLMQERRRKVPEIAYFKRFVCELQTDRGSYQYFKVYGGPGETMEGYQEVICFLLPDPTISVEHNYSSSSAHNGTWCTYENGERISKEEYEAAYEKATAGNFTIR